MSPTTNDVMRVRTLSECRIRVVEIGTPNPKSDIQQDIRQTKKNSKK
jgi:hypothetical protein